MTSENKPLNPTDGHIIAGTSIDDHRFLGRVRAAQLFQIAPDPRDTENRKKLDSSRELQEFRGVRDEVQRLFEGAKKRNVAPYADYIVALRAGDDGLTPAITLFSDAPLPVQVREDGTGFIQVPWDKRLVAIDGETQLAARHEAANISPATKHEFVAVYVNHGRDQGWARQAFSRPQHARRSSQRRAEPRDGCARPDHACLPRGRTARSVLQGPRQERPPPVARRATPRSSRSPALRGACVTLAKGINGVQFGARPVPIDHGLVPQIETAAIDWFAAFTDAFGPALANRAQSLASSPTAMAALGAVGNPLVHIEDAQDRALKARELVQSLRSVDWSRDKTWEGIAGKFTPKGAFSLGGSKETAYAVYAALSDPTSPGYARVRNTAASKAA